MIGVLQTIVPSRKNRHCPTGMMTMRTSTTTKMMCALAKKTTVLQAQTEIIFSKTMQALLRRRLRIRAARARLLAAQTAMQTIIKVIVTKPTRNNTITQMIKETRQTLLTITDLTIKMLAIMGIIKPEAIWMTIAMVDV